MPSWLDPIVRQQAAHYGLSVEKHAALVSNAATYQHLIDSYQVDEPKEESNESPRSHQAKETREVP